MEYGSIKGTAFAFRLQSSTKSDLWNLYRLNRRNFYSLYTAIEAFSSFESSDTGNRVYGIQSLATAGERIPMNYSKSIEEVFCGVMQKVKLPFLSPQRLERV